MTNFFTYIFLCFIQIINIHEFYVSATKVDYSEENSSIQCVSRVFLDDLEKSFSFDDYIFSVNKNGKQKFDSLLKKYLNKNFSLILNDEKLKLSFIGTEIDNDLAIIYFEFSTTLFPSRFSIISRFSLFKLENSIKDCFRNAYTPI